MNRLASYALNLSLALLAPALAQAQKGQSTPLERAGNTFRVADADSNGKLDAAEISKASIRVTAARQWDVDRDGALSKDEFLVYYRQLVIDAGRTPGEGLERQVARIEKARKGEADKRVEQARKQNTDSTPPRGASGATTADKYRRAREALQERLTKAGSRSRAAAKATQGLTTRARGTVSTEGALPAAGAGGTTLPASSIRERLGRAQKAPGGQGTPGPTRGAGEVSLPRTLERADQNIVQQGIEKNARRQRVTAAQEHVNGRARAAVDEFAEPTAAERAKLQRSFEILEARARSAGWTAEQLAGQKRQLVKRLRDPEGARTDSTRRRADAVQDSQRVDGARKGAQPREREQDREEGKSKSDAPEGGGKDSKPEGSKASRGGGRTGPTS